MYLEQVKSFPKTTWWRYVIGIIIISVFYILGQFPLYLAWMVKKGGFEDLNNTPQRELMQILNQNTTLFFLLLMFVFALGGVLIALRIHNQTFKQLVTSRIRISWKRFFFSFFALSIFIVGSTLWDYQAHPKNYEWNFNIELFIKLCIIAVPLIPIQASVEEFIFRGYLMQGFAIITRHRWVALIITSVLFGVLHLSNPEIDKLGYYAMAFYIGTGLFLGIITLMDQGMELALGIHSANNLITALLVTADYSVLNTPAVLKQTSEPEVNFTIVLPLLVVYPILLLVFAKIYKWKNWKHKLLGAL